jgi:hypothetical protein
LPFGSSGSDRIASKTHLPTSAPFRVQAAARYPAGYAGRPAEGRPRAPVSRRLTAHRHSLLGHPDPARELGLRYLRLTGAPDGAPGPRRGFHVPHARAATGVGAPSTPRPAVFTRPTKICPAAACRSSTARPCTPVFIPSAGALGNEASAGVHSRSPVRPSPRLPSRMERERFGFFPELRTPQLPTAHVRAGTGLEHWPGATSPTSSSALQSTSSLTTCDLVSHVLSPVITYEQAHQFSRLKYRIRSAACGRTISALMTQCSRQQAGTTSQQRTALPVTGRGTVFHRAPGPADNSAHLPAATS